MKILFDTNIVLDAILDRSPHAMAAVRLMQAVRTGTIEGFLCATSVTTIYYLGTRQTGAAQMRRVLGDLLSMFEVCPMDKNVLAAAANSPMADYEDAVVHESASRAGLDAIVTRDIKGFRKGRLAIYAPDDLLAILKMA